MRAPNRAGARGTKDFILQKKIKEMSNFNVEGVLNKSNEMQLMCEIEVLYSWKPQATDKAVKIAWHRETLFYT